jgi:hypothetical protein
MVVYLLSKERNQGCIVLLAIGYQSKDEEALVRVINYPARELRYNSRKLTIAANHYKRSIWEVMQNIDKLT